MAELGNKIDELTDNIKEYINIQYQLALLKVTDMASSMSAKILAASIIVMVFFLFLIFISIVAGFWFSTLTGSRETGFLIVGGFYLIVGFILVIFNRKLLIEPIKNSLIKHIFNNDK